MSRKKGVMSGRMKHELAKDLGFAKKVDEEGWASITTGEAGGMVRRAVEIAERQMVNGEMHPQNPAEVSSPKETGKPDSRPGTT